MAKQRFSVEQVAAALRACGGFRSHAAERLGCSPSTVANYINRSPRLQEIDHEIREAAIDLAEDRLIAAIKRGNIAAICFFLKCKGKSRGYVERQEVTGADGGPMQAEVHFASLLRLSPEERAAKIAELTARIEATKARLN